MNNKAGDVGTLLGIFPKLYFLLFSVDLGGWHCFLSSAVVLAMQAGNFHLPNLRKEFFSFFIEVSGRLTKDSGCFNAVF